MRGEDGSFNTGFLLLPWNIKGPGDRGSHGGQKGREAEETACKSLMAWSLGVLE